jgi:Dolichyl-phosphate-mannose-protein mannosyltransferase
VAIDFPARRLEELRLPLGLWRISAIPAKVTLAGVVGASFLIRFVAALGHATPLYFPDEYIYASLSRSLAEHGRPLIRGGSAHFPALLEPLAAAPFWLFHDPLLAYRLTQTENALAMSLAAVPVYLLTRRLGLGSGLALVAAALAVASPDLFFVSFVLADPLAYPLVLGAVYAGVCALSRPTWRWQAAFLVLSAAAMLTRIQYALLPVVFVVGAIAVERGSVRAVLARFRFTWAIFVAPLLGLVVLGPSRVLGYYNSVVDLHIAPGSILHWIATDSMLLVYCAGWVLIPGAVIGFGYALGRPRSREEAAFAGVTAGLLLILFAETSLYASNGSPRFQERYFMALLPLVLPWFGLYLSRGRPARLVTCLFAVVLLAVSARVPLAPYAVADNKQDSPFLLGVFRLEHAIGVADGSLVIAIVAAVLSALAAAIVWRARLAVLAIGLALLLSLSASAGSISFDHHVSRNVRADYLPADARWIDHARLGAVLLVQTPATLHARAHEQLFWNRSLADVVFFDQASPIDAFGAKRLTATRNGRLVLGDHVVRSAMAISTFAVRMQLRGASVVGRGADYELWKPHTTPRVAMFVGGLYYDRWLAQAGRLTVWPANGDRVSGTLRLKLSLPPGTQRTVLQLRAPHLRRNVVVLPRHSVPVMLPVNGRGPWTLHFRTTRPGYLTDGRTISVQAAMPVFTAATHNGS